jgi:argininosuccinate lyase
MHRHTHARARIRTRTRNYTHVHTPTLTTHARAQNVPFRETHHISGAAVKMAEDRNCLLSDLTPADLRTIHPLFDDDVAQVGGGCLRGQGLVALCVRVCICVSA